MKPKDDPKFYNIDCDDIHKRAYEKIGNIIADDPVIHVLMTGNKEVADALIELISDYVQTTIAITIDEFCTAVTNIQSKELIEQLEKEFEVPNGGSC